MRKAYLETSAINYAKQKHMTGKELRLTLENLDHSPVIGMHTIYELARTFFDTNKLNKGAKLFSLIEDLDPSIMPPVRGLLNQEIDKFLHGTCVLPFLSHLDQHAVRLEVARLASGTFDNRAKEFISGREANIRANYPQFAQSYIERVVQAKATNPEIIRKIKTFQDAYNNFEFEFPSMILEILRGKISKAAAPRMYRGIDSFPALRSTIRANLYISFLCIVHKVRPGFDKLDDYRHAIEASYCGTLVTGDRQLIHAVQYINPDLTVLENVNLA
jgi:hypothetical protein